MKHILLAAAAMTAAAPASAAQLLLGATNIVGVNSTYFAGTGQNGVPFASSDRVTSRFGAGNIFDTPFGTVAEPTQTGYWIAGDDFYYPGVAVGTITIDLGESYALSSFQLFNTHNSGFNDRGTGQFEILGGNAVVGDGANGLTLAGPTALLAADTLDPAAFSSPITGKSVTVANTGGYRYLQFRALSVAATSPVTSTGTSTSIAYGLNELRVFGDAAPAAVVPEPATWISLTLGFGLIGGAVRRRRTLFASA